MDGLTRQRHSGLYLGRKASTTNHCAPSKAKPRIPPQWLISF
jgi:hypothetical protein